VSDAARLDVLPPIREVLAVSASRRLARCIPLALIALLAIAPSAHAGRLIESGHDFDFHCAAFVPGDECHFMRVALDYVRAGAPDPSKPVLVLDRGALAVPAAIQKAYAPGSPPPMTVVDPRSGTFPTTPIDTSHWSAIVVASDVNCSGCDLNSAPSGSAAQTPDSTAIALRTATIAAFFDAGGGILAGAGATDSGGSGTLTFSDTNVPYYSFLATSGASNATGPFQLTALGTALGLVDLDVNFPCGGGCTHNSFGFPPAGSRLKPAEVDPTSGRFVTLIEDTDPPVATVASGPPAQTTSTGATFSFTSSEAKSTYQCRLDGAPFATCATPFSTSGISEGRHVLDVRAVDLVGNVQPTPTAYQWSVCLDRDGDGFTSCSSPPDCNDNSATVNPSAPEVNGNKVDENCDGFSAPFDRVDAAIGYLFDNGKTFSTVAKLDLSKITTGAKVTATCSGGGCPFKSKKVTVKGKKAHLAKLFKKKNKKLRLKLRARIQLTVSKSGSISKVFTFKVRGAKGPSFASQCQLPGSKKLQTTCAVFAAD